ncbi:DUF645 family protein [Vibrio cholerae]|nr:DUF645 family protein [Vibrio cholerae]
MLLDVQRGQLSCTKCCIIAVIWLSLSLTLNCDQLSLDRFRLWLPASQLLVLGVCSRDAFT